MGRHRAGRYVGRHRRRGVAARRALTGAAVATAALTLGYALSDRAPSLGTGASGTLATPPAVSTPGASAELSASITTTGPPPEAPVAAVSTLPGASPANPTEAPATAAPSAPGATTPRPTTTAASRATTALRTTTPTAAPPVPPPTSPSAGTMQQRIYTTAVPYLNRHIPYIYGGKLLSGMDCSALVWFVLREVRPGTPYRASGALRAWATPIPKSNAVQGDLVFWPQHVGIYAGNNQVIDQGGPGPGANLRTLWPGYTFGRVPR